MNINLQTTDLIRLAVTCAIPVTVSWPRTGNAVRAAISRQILSILTRYELRTFNGSPDIPIPVYLIIAIAFLINDRCRIGSEMPQLWSEWF